MSDILLLAAHPDLGQSRVNRAMLDAVQGAGFAPERLAVRDLYRLYPDYAIDVQAEQAALAAARLIVLLHPLQWYSMPGLQKLWLDEVLRFGWAYGPGGEALAGKDLWLALSTGGAAESYSAEGHNGHAIDTFLLPYSASARLCGLRWLPPLVLHGAHRVSDARLARHVRGFVEQLQGYPQWTAEIAASPTPEVPIDARPALFSALERRL
ncbi:MAG TPA: NAD(P)H-dependent oxidoreductase [Burkholderiaceae bacterium]